MKLYFDRTLPMFLTEEPSFDGHLVEVDDKAAAFILLLGDSVAAMKLLIDRAGAPEDTAQELADQFMLDVIEILREVYNAAQTRL